ncbi:MAG: rod shape-determining protein RodA [bacterium]
MPHFDLKRFDLLLGGAALFLVVLGLILLSSTSKETLNGGSNYFERQFSYAIVGLFLMIAMMALSPRVHFSFAYWIYGICCLILVSVLVWGKIVKGAESWMQLGSFTFQPSEPAKIGLVLALARLFSHNRFDIRKFPSLLKAILLTAIPLALVMAQPDFGTAIVFGLVFLFMIIAAGIPVLHFFFLISPLLAVLASFHALSFLVLAIILIILAWRARIRLFVTVLLILGVLGIGMSAPQMWNQLKPYQQKRLISFLHPEADPKGSGYQVIQSKVAIGSGGLWGKGLGKGSQTQLKFLPEQHTDFIFSVVGEELGLLGSSLVLVLFGIFIIRGYRNASRIRSQYSAFVSSGLCSMIAAHIFINIGMATGIMPVTGLPLPFLSYGGSFLWTTMISTGLILGIQYRWKEYAP